MQTASDLRKELADMFQAVKKGEMPIDKAEALSNIAGKMIASALAQVKYNHISESSQQIPWLEEPAKAIESTATVVADIEADSFAPIVTSEEHIPEKHHSPKMSIFGFGLG